MCKKNLGFYLVCEAQNLVAVDYPKLVMSTLKYFMPLFSVFLFFGQAVNGAIAAGVDGYDADVKASVRKAAHGLRLTRESAMSIASKAVSILSSLCFCSIVSFV